MKARILRTRGIAATELAICLPLLFLLTMFCVQLAQGYHIRSVADQAAWRAIRYASTTRVRDDEVDAWKADVTSQAVDELSQLAQFDAENLSLNVNVTSNNERVEIELQLDLIVDNPLRLMPGNFEVHRNLQIRQYR
ncbi:pilus assembly protein [Bremerella cremea]|uniref:TadE-like domain-containing protein n=1 Tax=Blastopirellula marina TaxID=124 RepID=A0A2S8FUN6_9BACT|nr:MULTISPECIES: TadE family protein [Pirellulaceae]PQO35885.1 hypothetical protein C5Y83_08080 [Blastopirellula marina]RCS48562.1 pilus assembly protein [Bremerella cremea]